MARRRGACQAACTTSSSAPSILPGRSPSTERRRPVRRLQLPPWIRQSHGWRAGTCTLSGRVTPLKHSWFSASAGKNDRNHEGKLASRACHRRGDVLLQFRRSPSHPSLSSRRPMISGARLETRSISRSRTVSSSESSRRSPGMTSVISIGGSADAGWPLCHVETAIGA